MTIEGIHPIYLARYFPLVAQMAYFGHVSAMIPFSKVS